jgi:phage-related protein
MPDHRGIVASLDHLYQFRYTAVCVKPLSFLGSSLDDLRAFPETARREAGHQLDQVQRGLDPDDWKSMPSVGAGVREVRIRDQAGAFRVIYLMTRPEAVYVLHAFQKKTQATAKRDLDLAEARLRELTRSRP